MSDNLNTNPANVVTERGEEVVAVDNNNNQAPVQTGAGGWLSREPVAVQAVIQAAIAMAMGFGFDISPEQMGLILMFTAAVLGLITRQQVTPFISTGVPVKSKGTIEVPRQ